MAAEITAECLLLAAAAGVTSLLALVRIVQGAVLQYRETGTLLTRYPDTPAMRRWHHVNNVLLGSISCVVSFVVACHLAYAAWWGERNGMNGWRVCLYGVPLFLGASVFIGIAVWRSTRRTPKD